MFRHRGTRLSTGLLISTMVVAVTLPCAAQHVRRALPGTGHEEIVQTIINVPGSGPMKVNLMVLPKGADRGRDENSRAPFDEADAFLFSNYANLNGDNLFDPLWLFPTTGYDVSLNETFIARPNTAEAAPAPNNVLNIFFGELGKSAKISQLYHTGNLYDLSSFGTAAAGSFAIVFWDGVDAATPPTAANLGVAEFPDGLGNPINGFLIRRTAPNTTTPNRTTSLDANRMQIRNARGKFGMSVYKVTDPGNVTPSPASVQWWWYGSAPGGPNRVWRLTGGSFTNPALVAVFADTSVIDGTGRNLFNQGAAGRGTINFLCALRGDNLDGTPASSGTLQGNLRRRGVDPPDGSPEDAPGAFLVRFYQPNTTTLLREVPLFANPSYDAAGVLTINYQIPGVAAGTYDIEIRQMPLIGTVNMVTTNNVVWNAALWPFGDYNPVLREDVVITGGVTTTLNARLERLGDIDNASGTGTPDGAVDVFDLAALITSFNRVVGDPDYLDAADLVGDPSVNEGRPDGAVDIFDLAALVQVFNTGELEAP